MKKTGEEKKLGAFYTPKKTVDYMVGLLRGVYWNSTLLEPSGGDGAFVERALETGLFQSHNVTVFDINPEVKAKDHGINFFVKDTLLDQTSIEIISHGIEGRCSDCPGRKYTHIIGNPPYLNKGSEYIKNNKKMLQKVYKEIGANDTYAMFIYLSYFLLEDGGQCVFLVSDTYRTLGTHSKLRKFILSHFTIDRITICPERLFSPDGATIKTSILCLTKKKAPEDHYVKFTNCSKIKHFNGPTVQVRQKTLEKMPDSVFCEWGYNIWRVISKMDCITKYLTGGLGMHTGNNSKYLFDNNESVHENNDINAPLIPKFKYYHKRGGSEQFYHRVEHVAKWNRKSPKKCYDSLVNVKENEGKKGFLISGISTVLTARVMQDGAAWESNKAMCFFPKDPDKYPVEFFIGILNTPVYDKICKIFNHTSSFQVRDINKIPLLPFTDEEIEVITNISKGIIKRLKKDQTYNYTGEVVIINKIAAKYVDLQKDFF